MNLRFAPIFRERIASLHRSLAAFLRRVVFALLFLLTCGPAFSQVAPPEPDPLARIRAQAPAPACSEAEPTLCAEAAPKIIANATGSDSTIQKNLSILASGEGGHAMGAPAPQSVVDDVRVVDWAVAAFRAAGLDVHTEPASPSSPGLEDVIAEIPGREEPKEIVILAAAIDPSVIGNNIAAAADATVLTEAARDIAATGLVPRRTIRFVLFVAGGPNACGASNYVAAHGSELDSTIAAIFIEQGTGNGTRYLLSGRNDIEPQVREALKPLDNMGLAPDSFDDAVDPCAKDFFLQGVPTLAAEAAAGSSGAAPPALDQMDFQELSRHAAFAGVTAFDVSEDVAPLGPRLSPAEVQALTKPAGSQ
jgi:peptidase M28-like protein